jgi:hypothetical protein
MTSQFAVGKVLQSEKNGSVASHDIFMSELPADHDSGQSHRVRVLNNQTGIWTNVGKYPRDSQEICEFVANDQ